MGICKCKKRTDLFCFVHKKAVCDTCIATDHQVCVVKSYVHWLEEPEYENPVCGICKGELNAENSVRFLCLDMFHPECIDMYASALPVTTAMAGYTCPTCDKPILPTSNNNSALAQQIKKAFSFSNWATRVLGSPEQNGTTDSKEPFVEKRPLNTEPTTPPHSSPAPLHEPPSIPSYTLAPVTSDKPLYTEEVPAGLHPLDPLSYHPPSLSNSNNNNIYPPSSTTININPTPLSSSTMYGMASQRKPQKPFTTSPTQMDEEDEDKYRRKGVMQLFAALGLLTSSNDPKRGPSLDPKRATIFFAALATIIIFLFMYFVVLATPENPVTIDVDV